MPEPKAKPTETAERKELRRKTLVGEVVSTRTQKTIVVAVTRKYSHRLYRRVMSVTKKYYAHDEQNSARVGDVVRLEETRPLSKLKRWRLKDTVRRAKLVAEDLKAARKPQEQAS